MDGEVETTLDYIDGINVPGDPFKEAANEYWALLCLRHGLECIAAQAQTFNAKGLAANDPDGKTKSFVMGRLPGLDIAEQAILTCMFHWYSVSACNYVRIVGAIAYQQDNSRPIPPVYIGRIMPDVLEFRDKVGAHLAWSTKNRNDTDADRLWSSIPQLAWWDDSFKVNAVAVRVRKGDKESNSVATKPWSITGVHEQLRARFWREPQA